MEDSTTALDLPLTSTLREAPRNVGDAIERVVRIDALRSWLSDLRDATAKGYIGAQADQVETLTGAAFRAPVAGLGLAYRTDPQPKPDVSDREAFARWYVVEILQRDPDEQPSAVEQPFDGHVTRRTVASVSSSALLAFLGRHARADHDGAAAETLSRAITVDVEWVVSETVLVDLLAGKLHSEQGRPRLIVKGDRVLDRTSSEVVPGTVVRPAGPKTLTIKPDAAAKERIRQELDDLLGPPMLAE